MQMHPQLLQHAYTAWPLLSIGAAKVCSRVVVHIYRRTDSFAMLTRVPIIRQNCVSQPARMVLSDVTCSCGQSCTSLEPRDHRVTAHS